MVLFMKREIEGRSLDEVRCLSERVGLDSRIGHIAIVAEFLPPVLEAQRFMQLEPYLGPLKEKIIARRALN